MLFWHTVYIHAVIQYYLVILFANPYQGGACVRILLSGWNIWRMNTAQSKLLHCYLNRDIYCPIQPARFSGLTALIEFWWSRTWL